MSNELQELQNEIRPQSESAQALIALSQKPIGDSVVYTAAADMLKDIKGRYKLLDDREKEITRPINASLKAIRDLFRGPKDLLSQAESGFKRSMIAFQRAEEEKRLAAQRAAEELARKERERLERLAEAARKRDDVAKVEQFEQRAAAVVAPIIQAEKPKVAGIATRKRYTFQIVDAAQIPHDYLQPDTIKIGKVVRALGTEANIPGIRVIEEETIASRAFA